MTRFPPHYSENRPDADQYDRKQSDLERGSFDQFLYVRQTALEDKDRQIRVWQERFTAAAVIAAVGWTVLAILWCMAVFK